MNQQYRISEHEILYYDNSKVQLFCYYMPTTKHNTWQHQRVKLPNSNINIDTEHNTQQSQNVEARRR
jgi:hypothetical protein